MTNRTQILDPERVDRILNRIAYEIVERNKGASTLEIVGIRKKGLRLAQSLARRIAEIESVRLHPNDLDVSAYRDDRPAGQSVDASSIQSDMAGRDVILVDDVLFTGRTARAALDAIVHYGRPRSIQLVVLIDRGHREFPIQPDYVGRTIPTKHRERVEVDVDGELAVFVEE
jgi:pyrimidine operon attenuation protein/uracil phosphoribosyltransferase